MTHQTTFSIIIPTLNEEKFLPRLLEDLSKQTISNFEVIHIDGKSEDKTREVAQKYAHILPSFNQIISQIRHVSHQRNLGAKTATGEYLLFIDADTQLPPYFLEGLSFQLHKNPSDVFTTWSVPDSKKTADKAFITLINLGLEISHFIESPVAIGVFMGCTTKAFKKIGGFLEDVNYGEDEDFVKTGFKKKLHFHIYNEPRFIYSLRRFRKEGTLTTLQQLATKRLHALTGNGKNSIFKPTGYTMGGHIFQNDDPNRTLIKQIDDFIKDLANKAVPPKQKQKIATFIKRLTALEEINK